MPRGCIIKFSKPTALGKSNAGKNLLDTWSKLSTCTRLISLISAFIVLSSLTKIEFFIIDLLNLEASNKNLFLISSFLNSSFSKSFSLLIKSSCFYLLSLDIFNLSKEIFSV